MKKILTVLLSLTLLMLSAAACTGTAGDAEPSASAPESSQTPDSSADSETATDPYARKIGFTIEMENGDVMKGELYPDLAPETVANFVKLCNEHFYDGLIDVYKRQGCRYRHSHPRAQPQCDLQRQYRRIPARVRDEIQKNRVLI